jgi:hypothetical protein
VPLKVAPWPEELWHRARLIPTSGISGQQEQETRATSALLAVLGAVPQFGRAILQHLDAPAGKITTYTEVRFQDEGTNLAIPDGAIIVTHGKTRWVCLVEVKTSGVDLRADQVGRYLELARSNNFDAVLTISNQITSSPAESPLALDAKHFKRVALRHLSWWQIMTEAVVEHDHHGITDPDQAWILGELIAYLEHDRAGAGGFDDMGDRWVAVREGARRGDLKASDAGVKDVAARWEQLAQYLALGLTQVLGRSVEVHWPRNLDPMARREQLVRTLVADGTLNATLRVPDAAAPLELQANLRTRYLTTFVEMLAPREGHAKTRISWMLRQLASAPDNVRLEVRYPNAREPMFGALKDARIKPERLLYPSDLKREPRLFRIGITKELGAKRGKGQGSFVLESRQQTMEFYRTVLQGLRPWAARAPKLPPPQAAEPSGDLPAGDPQTPTVEIVDRGGATSE